jgi:hypothetical protein
LPQLERTAAELEAQVAALADQPPPADKQAAKDAKTNAERMKRRLAEVCDNVAGVRAKIAPGGRAVGDRSSHAPAPRLLIDLRHYAAYVAFRLGLLGSEADWGLGGLIG